MNRKGYKIYFFTHLESLKEILKEEKKKEFLFPCIEELVVHGIVLSRFYEKDEQIPDYKAITRYIAAWFRHIGISEEICRSWLTLYIPDVLFDLLSVSEAGVQLNTADDIRDIYQNDENIFDCGCEYNIFKASCWDTCPVYEDMKEKYKERQAREAESKEKSDELSGNKKPARSRPGRVTVKDQYIPQFEEAMEVVKELLNDGVPKSQIADILNDRGFRTRTGREWTYSILRAESKNLPYKPRPAEKKPPKRRSVPVKSVHRDQFEKARKLALPLLKKGKSTKEVADRLNKKGYRTRTGRKWTPEILRAELNRADRKK